MACSKINAQSNVLPFPAPRAPSVDVEKLLLSGHSTPTVPVPMALQTAIERRAKAIGEQARKLAKEHLQRRIAYTCEFGHPTRVLDMQRAYAEIAHVDIGSALVSEYRRHLLFCLRTAEAAVDCSQKAQSSLREAIADLDKQATG